MRVEEVEKLSKKELRSRANACFADAEVPGYERAPLLFYAQFYMRELEHRADSWVSIRDFILEIIVIALIGWEIHMGYRQAADQATQFNSQQAIFQNLQKSSEATAATLTALEGTTENMNGVLQKQLALFYDVSVNVLFNVESKQVGFINNGRTNVSIWGIRAADEPITLPKEGRIIPPGGAFLIPGNPTYGFLIKRFPKPAEGLLPFEVFIKNERGEQFIQHGYVGIRWQNDMPQVIIQTSSIVPESWTKVMGGSAPDSPKVPSVNP